MVRKYNGKCLIRTYNNDFLIWMNEDDVLHDGNFIEFSVSDDQDYFVSSLNLIMNSGLQAKNTCQFSGTKLIKLFEIDESIIRHNRKPNR